MFLLSNYVSGFFRHQYQILKKRINQTLFPFRPALYYGKLPLPKNLDYYNVVILESEGIDDENFIQSNKDKIFIYVSVCEVDLNRPWINEIPQEWIKGENQSWGSKIIDQTPLGWPQFYLDYVITPLWSKGYRNFFLDTLDSYYIFANSEEEQIEQQKGLTRVINKIKTEYPNAKLIFNRGFEIINPSEESGVRSVKEHVYAILVESLFQEWDNLNQKYVHVNENERNFLLSKINQLKNEGIPIIVVDYAPQHRRKDCYRIAKSIYNLGFYPWVADGLLEEGGVGIVDLILYHGW